MNEVNYGGALLWIVQLAIQIAEYIKYVYLQETL